MSDKINLCPNCFAEEGNNDICPDCGYDIKNRSDNGEYLPAGTILIGKYMIGKVLGHGGFGATYLGMDLTVSEKVAIKEYLPAGVAVREKDTDIVTSYIGKKGEIYKHGLRNFIEEAKVLSKFSAVPSIVSIFDVFTANGTAYIVMEYLEGESLSSYVKNNAPLSSDIVIEFALPLCDALKKVHNAGIIHRDISLENIYLMKDGKIKLLDFGAARLTLVDDSTSLSVILKPGYAPIEQYSRKGVQGPWTDIYALAATIYHMFTGYAPTSATDRAT
ncbi:MAG: serine/threonine protein kinase, partial [Clostridiales bacterium]|nr:serine/threonine protein kinase [Clostridiales bacterium]